MAFLIIYNFFGEFVQGGIKFLIYWIRTRQLFETDSSTDSVSPSYKTLTKLSGLICYEN